MADFGSPVAQNVQPPSLQSLSTLMGLRGQQLQQQQQQQNLDKGAAETQMTQQTAQQRAAVAGVDWSKYDDGTGTISTDKMLGDASLRKAAGDSFLDVVKQGAAMRGMQLQNKQTLVSLNDGLRNQFGAVVGALRTDPDVIADNPTGRQKVAQAITQFGEAGGPDAMKVAQIYAPVAVHAPQGKLVRGINAIQLQAMDASRQASAQSPTYVDNGQQLTPTNPQAAGGSLGAVPPIQKQLPPTTPVMRGSMPSYVGAPGTPPVQAAPALGQEAGITGPVAANNVHYGQIQADAQNAPNRIAALQTIKQEAPDAITGGGTVKDYLRKLNQVFSPNGDINTAQDIMAKNLAVMAAQGGNTDAARALGEMGTPSFHMTAEAARQTADQLIGIEAKKQAASSYFQGVATNDPLYGKKVAAWNLNADPRAFEYAAKSPEDQAAMKASMQKAGTWKALQQKMVQLHIMGVDPQ